MSERRLDLDAVPTPCHVCDTERLERNLRLLASVAERSGCKVLLALKGFALFNVFPLCRRYLQGTTASSLDEARLGAEEFGGEVHVNAPAYRLEEFPEFLGFADHVVFNSFSQWRRLRGVVEECRRPVSCGMRVNPEHSEVSTVLYDPCQRHSRLGVTRAEFREEELQGVSGLLFHTLCEQEAASLERTLHAFEERFGRFADGMRWLNFGGGQLITREGYDVDLLCELVRDCRERYGVEVYLEPGAAVAWDAGVLVTTVLDIVHNEMDIALLDTSAAAHMPDVLEMPYRPRIEGAGEPGEFPHTYRLGGSTCLAGDVVGDYSFPEPLEVGRKLVLLDMAHYTLVKSNTFNGVPLPSIALHEPRSGELRIVRRFGHEDYKGRLGAADLDPRDAP